MNVLVTGGAGYVGSHACKELARAGHVPIAYDDLSTGHRAFVRWGPLAVGDVADADRVRRAVRNYDVAAVVHFAASAYVGESMADPRRYARNNVVGSVALLDVVVEEGVRIFVSSSTCAVYGTPAHSPIAESAPLAPLNPYGASKAYVEELLASYGRAYGLRWTALRYFNAAGADPDGEVGERHDPETRLVPRAILAALGGPALAILGVDHPTPDGTCVRDYVHVSDLAAAHVAALERLSGGGEPRAFNLGTGAGASVREVVRAVERASGRSVPSTVEPPRRGDPPSLVADASLARAELGWDPKLSGLNTIVASALRWHRSELTRGPSVIRKSPGTC